MVLAALIGYQVLAGLPVHYQWAVAQVTAGSCIYNPSRSRLRVVEMRFSGEQGRELSAGQKVPAARLFRLEAPRPAQQAV